jgi:hypothetical protein
MKLVVSLAASLLITPHVDPPVLELAGIHRTEDVHVRRACVYAPIVGATFGFAF